MGVRKVISLTAFLSFFIVMLTSVLLYIVPQGRVAYWADWRLWTLSKEQWGAIHINAGVLFLLCLLVHIYYNRRPIAIYIKHNIRNNAKKVKIASREFLTALAVTLVVVIGTHVGIPPFSTIIAFSEQLKETAASEYGEPPYAHAELSSLANFARKMEIDLNLALPILRQAGYLVTDASQSIKEIARANRISPQQLYLVMQADKTNSPAKRHTLPEQPVPGSGNLTLAELCEQYELDSKAIADALLAANYSLEEQMTLKEIGRSNHVSPTDIYDQIRAATGAQLSD